MFYKTIANEYHKIFPVREDKLRFVKKHIVPDKILDIGCSVGELSYLIAKSGYKVIGVDLDATQIGIAKKRYVKESNLQFIKSDMLFLDNIFTEKSFNSILCLGNVLVHLNGLQVLSFLNQVYNLLENKGIFIGQIVNYDKILSEKITEFPEIETENVKFIRKYNIRSDNTILFTTTYILKKSGEQITGSVPLFPLKSGELKNLLQQSGFSNINFYGNFKEVSYLIQSPASVFTATKNL
ncbi:MAG: class I SAM-dependent methyltransferase [Chlorobi bacterium]|nr:class I SAM-dependent methyltransferase [Chlorobiota bacterium]